jgi:hypothetical protein
MRWITRTALAVLVSAGLVAGSLPSVSAAGAPAVTRHYARKLDCKNPQATSSIGPSNSGVLCGVHNSRGRQLFLILKYANVRGGSKAWKNWSSGSRYIAQRFKVLLVPQGTRTGGAAFTKKWAHYAANRVNGRVIHFP